MATHEEPLLPGTAAGDGGAAKGPAGAATPAPRKIAVLDAAANLASKFPDNGIATAKYSFIPLSIHFFVWKNLFEQFHKAANCYFLLIASLQLVPGLSPTGRFTTLIPLCFVLIVTMLKEVFEDIKRHKNDRMLNNKHTEAFRAGKWQRVLWKDLAVGDLCRVSKGHAFPADLVLLWSPLTEGMCYIETASLDGETNLKLRKAPGGIYKIFQPSNPDGVAGQLVCEQPNNNLHNFDGYYQKTGGAKVSLTADNLLLRGAELRNTADVIGAVVFTGIDTKLMRNSSGKTSKLSHVDHVTNRQIVYVFGLQLGLCVGCTMGALVIASTVASSYYLPGSDPLPLFAGKAFATFLILFNNLIPISLYVTLEMVKVIQAGLIDGDIEMYHLQTNTAAQCRTSSLTEELGQIEYVFSDKTGTLTCNMMDFLKFTCSRYDSFQGKDVVESYGTGITEIARSAAMRDGGKQLKDDRPPDWEPTNNFFFYDSRIVNGKWASQGNADTLEFYLSFLAVCHAVIPEIDAKGVLAYQSSSPDEGCLVKAAQELGVIFQERTDASVTIEVLGKKQRWDILQTIEFNSTRKRMSVICQDPKGRLMILTKGADSVMFERIRKEPKTAAAHATTLQLLTQFAAEGLRTLVLAKADLDEATYSRWARKYHEASTSIVGRADKMAAVAEEIELDLLLVGTTAIEDKLQMGVPETIELLMTAGIKVWVLTGDKQETAINIGFACALLHSEMGLFMFDDVAPSRLLTLLRRYLNDAREVTQQDLGLVIQGDMLTLVLPDEGDKELKIEAEVFLALATRCRAVICCRVSPLQKAKVVTLVKDLTGAVSLAIGDGANDVSMIQAAHMGVGISGLEGLQAAMASDVSIAQFRFLQRLLLVHGRYNYRRVSKLIMYCFYKNITLFLTQFWFATFNLFTGQSLYDQWALSLYNLFFTATPIVAMAALDRDVPSDRLLSTNLFPELYHDGMKNLVFNTLSFWLYMFNAILHSLTCVMIPMFACELMTDSEGRAMGLVSTGITAYTSALIVVTLKITTETQSLMVPHAVANIASVALWFVFLGVYGNLYSVAAISDFAAWYGATTKTLGHPVYWLTVLVTVTVGLSREYAWKCWKHHFSQRLMHIVQEFIAQGKTFSRRDVLRCSPHLLPKFDALRPYEPSRRAGGLGNKGEASSNLPFDVGVNMRNIFGSAKRGAITALAGGQSASTSVGDATMTQIKDVQQAKRAAVTGSFFAQPGKVNIRDMVFDDLI